MFSFQQPGIDVVAAFSPGGCSTTWDKDGFPMLPPDYVESPCIRPVLRSHGGLPCALVASLWTSLQLQRFDQVGDGILPK